MSSLNAWNSHELDTKKNCQCLALGGNTFVSLPNGQIPAITVQINEDKNFTAYFGFTQEGDVYSSVFAGKWKCCKNLFIGIGLQHFTGTQYKRLTVEINPVTLEARYRVVIVDYVAGDCLSSATEHIVDAGVVRTVTLQPVFATCGSDLEIPIPQ